MYKREYEVIAKLIGQAYAEVDDRAVVPKEHDIGTGAIALIEAGIYSYANDNNPRFDLERFEEAISHARHEHASEKALAFWGIRA